MKITEFFVILLYALFVYLAGAISHERDLSLAFEKYGDAKGWFYLRISL
jgi:hypothetical protein